MLNRLGAWCCFAVVFTGAAFCQGSTPERHIHFSADVYAGYSLVAPDFSDYNDAAAVKGVGGGADLHITQWLAAAGEAHWMHVTYNPVENSGSVAVFGGPRLFLGTHRAITPFADLLGGATTFNFHSSHGSPTSYTSNVSAAFAADAGVDIRVAGPLAVRVEGGFVHTGFTDIYSILQPFVHDQHGRLLIEGVWHF